MKDLKTVVASVGDNHLRRKYKFFSVGGRASNEVFFGEEETFLLGEGFLQEASGLMLLDTKFALPGYFCQES